MATYSYPGVYVQELQSPVHPITGVPTSIAAFVGYTESGIDNRAQQIFSFSDFERLYGGLALNSELSYAVQQFFQNGGAQAWIVRTPGLSVGTTAASVQFASMIFTALSSGAAANENLLIDIDYIGLTPATDLTTFNLTVTNLAGGTPEYFPSVTLSNTKSNYVLTIVNDPDNGSQLVNASIASGLTLPTSMVQTGVVGTAVTSAGILAAFSTSSTIAGTVGVTQGQSTVAGTTTKFTTTLRVGQSVSFSADTTKTAYQIASIKSDTALTLTVPYTGATSTGDTVTLYSGQATSDFGLTISTSSPATPPSGLPITVKVVSKASTVPQTLSGFASQIQQSINAALAVQMPGASVVVSVTVLPAGQALRFNASFPSNPDAVLAFSDPAAASQLSATLATLGLTAPTSSNVAHYALGTGNVFASQTASTAGADGGLPATTDLIGDQAAFTGLYALSKVDEFNLLSIPDATRANPASPTSLDTTVDPNAIYSAAIALCDQRRAFLLVDPPPNVTTVAGAVDWKTSQLAVVDPNGAAFFPRLRLPDPLNNYQLRTFAPSGLVAGVYATTDNTRGVWKAPAGISATLNGVQGMVYQLSDAENGVLNPVGLNCFRRFPVYGSVLWGARTLVGADAIASQWKYVPVRRTALFIEESLYRGTQWVVFEPNDEPLWASIRLNVGTFMQSLFLQGYFQGTTPAQAYFVKCDSETTTQADIDLGIVNILVGFAPLKPAEFVVIQIEQLAGQSQP